MKTKSEPLEFIVGQVKAAAAGGLPLEIRGGGSKRFYGETPVGEPLELRPLAGITSYEPTELVVSARAGTLLSELETALGAQGQFLPFEPPRFGAHGTVGGMVAAGLSGPARASFGSVRDHVLGITLLNGRGELLTFGGQVAKNVAGYDVSRLMAGGLGILGVICEVSLKVMPQPVATATLCFAANQGQALQRLREWASQPLPISAGAWHDEKLHLRLSGASAAVSEASRMLGGECLADAQAAEWWRRVRDQQHDFFSLSAAELGEGECLWRVSVPPAAAPLNVTGREFIEWQGAQRWLRTRMPPTALRAAAAAAGGHATLVRAADKSTGVFTPPGEALLKLHRRLKDAFDPRGIFNRGRMYRAL